MTQPSKKYSLPSSLRVIGLTFLATAPFICLFLAPMMPSTPTFTLVLFLGGFIYVMEIVFSMAFLFYNVRTGSPAFMIRTIILFFAYVLVGMGLYTSHILRGLPKWLF